MNPFLNNFKRIMQKNFEISNLAEAKMVNTLLS